MTEPAPDFMSDLLAQRAQVGQSMTDISENENLLRRAAASVVANYHGPDTYQNTTFAHTAIIERDNKICVYVRFEFRAFHFYTEYTEEFAFLKQNVLEKSMRAHLANALELGVTHLFNTLKKSRGEYAEPRLTK